MSAKAGYSGTLLSDQDVPLLERKIVSNDMIWNSWPKRAAKIETDVAEDMAWARALPADLEDVKVCAVGAIWSGLRSIICKEPQHLY